MSCFRRSDEGPPESYATDHRCSKEMFPSETIQVSHVRVRDHVRAQGTTLGPGWRIKAMAYRFWATGEGLFCLGSLEERESQAP